MPPASGEPAHFPSSRFRFLNVERELIQSSDWNNPAWGKLWLYNLHYFDDLNAAGSESREESHRALMRRWIDENPPGVGNGWEPYTLSLRIVNWIRWALAGYGLASAELHSLSIQCRYVRRRLEVHLLGNHLLANAKALVFGGIFFEGDEAQEWLNKGLEILAREIPEQILPDGGHFERSPMYHSIILVDLLDLLNLVQTYPGALSSRWQRFPAEWRVRAMAMLRWLRAMTHPDGKIALFNDAAFGIASELQKIEAYASRLGVLAMHELDTLVHLSDSGYIRAHSGPACAFLDVGNIGPDYLPGHAHADTLSFELSLFDRRVIVHSGTSCYETNAERLRQRSTAAHNTVEIDCENSSEVWGSFRVARRARPFGLELLQSDDLIRVCCAHDGYRRLRGHPVHRREWVLRQTGMTVTDTVDGSFGKAIARFHFHPDCSVSRADENEGAMSLGAGRELRWSIEKEHGRGRLLESTYHPEFGMSVRNKCLEVELVGSRACTQFDWSV